MDSRFGAIRVGTIDPIAHIEGILATNEQKAREHELLSAEIVKAQMAADKELKRKIEDGFDIAAAIQQANLDAVAAFEPKLEAAPKSVDDQGNVVNKPADLQETVRIIGATELATPINKGKGKQ